LPEMDNLLGGSIYSVEGGGQKRVIIPIIKMA
jgi:hypothetical protein